MGGEREENNLQISLVILFVSYFQFSQIDNKFYTASATEGNSKRDRERSMKKEREIDGSKRER